jgi:hypothetical protein
MRRKEGRMTPEKLKEIEENPFDVHWVDIKGLISEPQEDDEVV